MNPKPRPNHHQYLAVLHSMTEGERLRKAFELSEFSKQLFKEGLRERFPEKSEEELHDLFIRCARINAFRDHREQLAILHCSRS